MYTANPNPVHNAGIANKTLKSLKSLDTVTEPSTSDRIQGLPLGIVASQVEAYASAMI
ncbi:hypothetical protein P7K49_014984, partial [Saguinus oedipus]